MKKILVVVAIMALAFSLVACGGNKDAGTTAPQEQPVAEDQTTPEETTPTEEPAAANDQTAPEETPAETPAE